MAGKSVYQVIRVSASRISAYQDIRKKSNLMYWYPDNLPTDSLIS
ncbi:MAG: hypothetical protein WC628_05155 [Candidatus Omnitrophota bacterium]